MAHKFFISHYSGDKYIAEIFSAALRRITLEQISPWFSSDSSVTEGLRPGDIWFTQILSKIIDSKAVVILLTPNSINRPWLYFESGIAQALEGCDVIPICIGIKRDNLLPPLGLYQSYQLSDYRSSVEFFSKLLSLFGIKFDEEMSKIVLERMITEISKITFDNNIEDEVAKKNVEAVVENLKSFIDRRFIELLERPQYRIAGDNLVINVPNIDAINEENTNSKAFYSIEFKLDLTNAERNYFLEVRENDSIQVVLNNIYFLINEFVKPYTYLESWIIKYYATDIYVVVREVADKIPAKFIFEPETKWDIILLTSPYTGTESTKRITDKETHMIWPELDTLPEGSV